MRGLGRRRARLTPAGEERRGHDQHGRRQQAPRDNGRETNTVGSPWLIAIARRHCSSAIGPRMSPSTAGTSGTSVARIASDTSPASVQDRDVHDRTVQRVGADRRQHQHAGKEQRRRHAHHPRPHAHERQVQHQQHHVADVEAGDEGPHQIGLRLKQQRARLEAVLLERRQQHRRRGGRRQAQRQQRHQHAGRGGVVGGFGAGHALDGAVPELARARGSAAAPRRRTGTWGCWCRRSAARPSGKPMAVPRSHGLHDRRHSSRVRLAPARSVTGSSGCARVTHAPGGALRRRRRGPSPGSPRRCRRAAAGCRTRSGPRPTAGRCPPGRAPGPGTG